MPRGKPKARTSSKSHDLEAIARLDRVMAPKQARSTESMQRILLALEQLLERKSFSEITMAEIEAQSGCGIATIYARFRDKDSILAALHESISERYKAGIDEARSMRSTGFIVCCAQTMYIESGPVKGRR